ncbi:hypothetical protein [Pyruvatibacter mobilis]|uniref:hypothetical protein n=1 Tax=Pyruvatibacter mobilis TaxID=1712261 RepID=UPI003BAC1E4D
MPIPIILAWAAAGVAGGYFFDRAGWAADRITTAAKWGAIGAGVYVGGKAFKVIK